MEKERIFEALSYKSTKCSVCNKIIWRNRTIILCYIKDKFQWLKCADCWFFE
jgi:hypothetical protein